MQAQAEREPEEQTMDRNSRQKKTIKPVKKGSPLDEANRPVVHVVSIEQPD